jgi:hypothetical protein
MNHSSGLAAGTVSFKKTSVVRVRNHLRQDTSATVMRANKENLVGI